MSSGNRRQGREIALKMIYSLFDQDQSLQVALDDFWRAFRFRDDILGDALEDANQNVSLEVRTFAEELVRGVYDQLETIDETLHSYSTNWSLERMARVDLALLRLSTYELMCRPDIPVNVIINEAVEIGKRYGTKETPAFINGILDRISRTCRQSG
jgi:N utilization substance protein B